MSLYGQPESTARKFIEERRKKYSKAETIRCREIEQKAEKWRKRAIAFRENQLLQGLEELNAAGEDTPKEESEWRDDKLNITEDLLGVLDLHMERCYQTRAKRWDRFIAGARRNMKRKASGGWLLWEILPERRMNKTCCCRYSDWVKAKLQDWASWPVTCLQS